MGDNVVYEISGLECSVYSGTWREVIKLFISDFMTKIIKISSRRFTTSCLLLHYLAPVVVRLTTLMVEHRHRTARIWLVRHSDCLCLCLCGATTFRHSNGYVLEEPVELVVLADAQLQMPRDDPLLLVRTRCIAAQLKQLLAHIPSRMC